MTSTTWCGVSLFSRNFATALVRELATAEELRPIFRCDFDQYITRLQEYTKPSSEITVEALKQSPVVDTPNFLLTLDSLDFTRRTLQVLRCFNVIKTESSSFPPADETKKPSWDRIDVFSSIDAESDEEDKGLRVETEFETKQKQRLDLVAKWEKSVVAEWEQVQQTPVYNNSMDFWADPRIINFGLLDMFVSIDWARKKTVTWDLIFSYLADCADVRNDEGSSSSYRAFSDPVYSNHISTQHVERVFQPATGSQFVVLTRNRDESEVLKFVDSSNFVTSRYFELRETKATTELIGADYIPSMNYLVCAFFDSIHILETEHFVVRALFKLHDAVTIVRWIPDLEKLVVGNSKGSVLLYTLHGIDRAFFSSKNRVVTDVHWDEKILHMEAITDILPKLVQNSLVTCSLDKSICMWNQEAKIIKRLSGSLPLGLTVVESLGLMIGFGVESAPIVWNYNVPSEKPYILAQKAVAHPHVARIFAVIPLTKPVNCLASVDRSGVVKIWDLWESICIQTIHIESNMPDVLLNLSWYVYNPKTSLSIVTGFRKDTIIIPFNDRDDIRTTQFASKDPPIISLNFVEGHRLFVTATKRLLTIWSAITYAPEHTFAVPLPGNDEITIVTVYEDSRLIIFGTRYGDIYFYSLGSCRQLRCYQERLRTIRSLLYFSHLDLLLVASSSPACIFGPTGKKNLSHGLLNEIDINQFVFHQALGVVIASESFQVLSLWETSVHTPTLWVRRCEFKVSSEILNIVVLPDVLPMIGSFAALDSEGWICLFEIFRGDIAPQPLRRFSSFLVSPPRKRSVQTKSAAFSTQRLNLVPIGKFFPRRFHSHDIGCPITAICSHPLRQNLLYVGDEMGFLALYDLSMMMHEASESREHRLAQVNGEVVSKKDNDAVLPSPPSRVGKVYLLQTIRPVHEAVALLNFVVVDYPSAGTCFLISTTREARISCWSTFLLHEVGRLTLGDLSTNPHTAWGKDFDDIPATLRSNKRDRVELFLKELHVENDSTDEVGRDSSFKFEESPIACLVSLLVPRSAQNNTCSDVQSFSMTALESLSGSSQSPDILHRDKAASVDLLTQSILSPPIPQDHFQCVTAEEQIIAYKEWLLESEIKLQSPFSGLRLPAKIELIRRMKTASVEEIASERHQEHQLQHVLVTSVSPELQRKSKEKRTPKDVEHLLNTQIPSTTATTLPLEEFLNVIRKKSKEQQIVVEVPVKGTRQIDQHHLLWNEPKHQKLPLTTKLDSKQPLDKSCRNKVMQSKGVMKSRGP